MTLPSAAAARSPHKASLPLSLARGREFGRFERLELRLPLAATALGDALLINDLVAGAQSRGDVAPTVAMTPGHTVAVFEGKGPVDRQGVFMKLWPANAEPSTVTAVQVNSTRRGDQHSPAVATDDDGNLVVVWAGRGTGDKHGIFFRRFDQDANPLGEETRVNQTAGGQQIQPAVAMTRNGSFAVAWSGVGTGDVDGVFWRSYNADGSPRTDELLVNSHTANRQNEPALAVDSTGNLLAAWTSRHQDGSDLGVFAQRLGLAGDPLGEELSVTTTTALSQSAPTLAIDPTGGFFAAWQSWGQDSDGWSVVGRSIPIAGTPAGAEAILNDLVGGHQVDPAIAVDGAGQVFAAWSSGVPDGNGWESVARTFLSDGTPDGESFAVPAQASGANSGHQRTGAVAIRDASAVVGWSGQGIPDRAGVYLQRYVIEFESTDPQQPPDLAPIADLDGMVGVPIEISITASDPNRNDRLTFLLDRDDAPPGAILEQIDGVSAQLRWTPPASAAGQRVPVRVLVVDDGEPPLSDAEEFFVSVAASS
jgi:hypothetical protein